MHPDKTLIFGSALFFIGSSENLNTSHETGTIQFLHS